MKPKWSPSPQQGEALQHIEHWLATGEIHGSIAQIFYLAGFAGTGKSTLAAKIARRIDGQVVFGAFTGKAASVMRSKGCDGADTIDALIYHPQISRECVAEEPCAEPCEERPLSTPALCRT